MMAPTGTQLYLLEVTSARAKVIAQHDRLTRQEADEMRRVYLALGHQAEDILISRVRARESA